MRQGVLVNLGPLAPQAKGLVSSGVAPGNTNSEADGRFTQRLLGSLERLLVLEKLMSSHCVVHLTLISHRPSDRGENGEDFEGR